MIQTETKKGASIKQIRERELKEKEANLLAKCNDYANQRFTEEQMKIWSVENKGIWYMPVLDDNDEIVLILILRPITRSILSYATTKIETEGLYEFLEVAMRECFIAGDQEIIDEDEYFLPAADKFNKIIGSKKVAMLKR